jgi:hypothetical protein
MKLDKAVELVIEAEEDLASALARLAGRHAADHDVYHLGHTLARRSREHLMLLAPLAESTGASAPDPDAGASERGPLDTVRRAAAAAVGRSSLPAMGLLLDLRDGYLTAQRAEVTWVILSQGAKAARHTELEVLAEACREETEATAKWLRTKIKEASPQVLVAG